MTDMFEKLPEEDKIAIKKFKEYLSLLNGYITSFFEENPILEISPSVYMGAEPFLRKGAHEFVIFLIYRKKGIIDKIKGVLKDGPVISENTVKEELVRFYRHDFFEFLKELENAEKEIEQKYMPGTKEYNNEFEELLYRFEEFINEESSFKYSNLLNSFTPIKNN